MLKDFSNQKINSLNKNIFYGFQILTVHDHKRLGSHTSCYKSGYELKFNVLEIQKMSTKELQDEEREVLSSIYDGDDCFKQIDPNTYQYKVNT